MKYNWTTKKLSEIAYINPRESIGKGVVAKKVPMDKLQPFCRDVPEFVLEEYKGGTKFRNGDTIMARITPCLENGKIAKVSILSDDEVGFGSTEYIVFRAIDGVSDADFLYYLICSPLIRNPAIKSMVGSSGRQRVQTDVVANLDIELPPIEEQRKIGGLLKAIDDKIELNNKINNNLEEQAQTLFKAWFVDFEFNSGIMPSHWHISQLGSVARISTEVFSPSKNPNVEVEHYSIPSYDEKRYPVFENSNGIKSNKYRLTSNSVMISKLNPDTKRIWRPYCISDRPICSTEFIVYEPINPLNRDFIYSIIDSIGFSGFLCSHTTGSTNSRQRATPSITLNYNIVLPDDETIRTFCSIVSPMYDTIENNIKENQKLAETRDKLLPKLMSGELDVSDIDL